MHTLQIKKKSYLLLSILLAALVTLSPFAIDTYLIAMPNMAEHFNVHLSTIELTITLYFLGYALGFFFGGPLSDSFGRKPICLTGIALYGIAALLIPISNKLEYILILRIVQAFGGGFINVIPNVFIRDWYNGKQVAKLITIISMIMMIAPLIAPAIGAILVNYFQWQGIFYFLAILSLSTLR